ncbi:MAG: hypothetical protein U9N48_02825 [Euryarchaeota archaeon]|nr:hypothetical protein [Euryarchaeota archaeon]
MAPGPWAFLVVEIVLGAIKFFHDQGNESLVSEVAKAVGVATRPMGWLLGEHGIRATMAHRGGKQGRCFTFDMRDRIEVLLSLP